MGNLLGRLDSRLEIAEEEIDLTNRITASVNLQEEFAFGGTRCSVTYQDLKSRFFQDRLFTAFH